MAGSSRFYGGGVVVAVVVAGSLSLGGAAAWADPVRLAQVAPTRLVDFAIAAQSMDTALTTFADQAGLRLMFRSEDVAGLRAPALNRRTGAEDALQALLAGSGLTWRATGPNSITVEKPGAEGALLLDPVSVEGAAVQAGENPTGPVQGYVARQALSATKTDTPLSETPQSITVVTRDDMTARNVRDVGEALRYTAGVTTGSRGEITLFGGNNVVMRGFGGDGTAGASSNEYLDGLRMSGTNYAVANLDTYLFERLEAVKGPASVLYGQITPGGLVNMVSKRPGMDTVREVRVGGGTHDNMNAAFDVGGAVNEHVQARLTGVTLAEDLQAYHTDRNRQAIAPALTLRSGPDTSLTILTNYQRDDVNGSPLNYVPAAGSVLYNPNGKISSKLNTADPNYNNWYRETGSVGYQFEHAFSDALKVRQNLRHTRNELDWKVVYASSLAANQRTLNRTIFSAVENSDSTVADTQVQGKVVTGPAQHTILAGLDLQRHSRDTLRAQATGPTLDMFNPVYYQSIGTPTVYQNIETVERQTGFYVQDQIKLGDLSVVAGLRHDRAQSESRNLRTGTVTPMDDSANTFRLGALYAFANGISPYVSYAESFEPTSGTDVNSKPFLPTTGQQYEVGVKYQPPGSNVLATASVFNLVQQNVLTPDPSNTNFNTQTGEVRMRGLELEGKLSLLDGLDLTAAYTYLETEVTKSNSTDLGKRRTGVPEHAVSVWADYTVPRGEWAGFGGGLGLRYNGETVGDSANTFEVQDYTLVDAALHYDLGQANPAFEGVRAAINASNLMNKEYVASCTRSTSCYWGQGRTVLGTLTYQW